MRLAIPLSEKTRNRLLLPFAISPILNRWAIPGIVGIALLLVGVVQKIRWLQVVGVVVAAPLVWCYFVVVFLFIPFAFFDKLRRGRAQKK